MCRINHKSSSALIIISILLASLMIFSFGCVKKEEKEIKIGAILPLSGNAAWIGEQHRWGIDIAVNEINSKGGINGKPIKMIYEDDRGNPLEGVNALNKLITTYKTIPVVLCGTSSTCMSIYKKAEENNIVVYANSGHPDIAKLSDWVFRNFLTAQQEAKSMAEFALNNLNIKEMAVMYINDSYGESGYSVFKEVFSGLGGKIILSEKYEKDGSDFKTEIAKILSKKPGAVYILGYGNSTAILLNQFKEFGYKGKFLGTNNFSGPPVNELAKSALEGAVFTAPDFFSENINPQLKSFVSKVKELYGKNAQWNSAVEYDAIYILAEAIRQSPAVDGKAVKDTLNKIGDYKGIVGEYKYSPTGEWQMGLSFMTYKNGTQIPYVRK